METLRCLKFMVSHPRLPSGLPPGSTACRPGRAPHGSTGAPGPLTDQTPLGGSTVTLTAGGTVVPARGPWSHVAPPQGPFGHRCRGPRQTRAGRRAPRLRTARDGAHAGQGRAKASLCPACPRRRVARVCRFRGHPGGESFPTRVLRAPRRCAQCGHTYDIWRVFCHQLRTDPCPRPPRSRQQRVSAPDGALGRTPPSRSLRRCPPAAAPSSTCSHSHRRGCLRPQGDRRGRGLSSQLPPSGGEGASQKEGCGQAPPRTSGRLLHGYSQAHGRSRCEPRHPPVRTLQEPTALLSLAFGVILILTPRTACRIPCSLPSGTVEISFPLSGS